MKQSLNSRIVGNRSFGNNGSLVTMGCSTANQSGIPLSRLRLHEEARVVAVDGEAAARHRLEEMGLRVGSRLRLLRRESPAIVAIEGRRLCLRLGEQLQVWVELCPPPSDRLQ